MLFTYIYSKNIYANYSIEDTERYCQGKDVQDLLIKQDAGVKPFAPRFMNECQKDVSYHFSST
jgi:hypothetical protein